MPVKLAESPFVQVLLRRGDIMALREILNHLLTEPTSLENSRLGVGETPLQIGDLVLELILGTVHHSGPLTIPLSVGCWPRLSGLSRSICLLVPPSKGSGVSRGLQIPGRVGGIVTEYGPSFPIAIDRLTVQELGSGRVSLWQSSAENSLGCHQGRELERSRDPHSYRL